MNVPRTVLAVLAGAALAAGGSTTVYVTAAGNEQGVAQRAPRAAEAQSATHGASAGATESSDAAELPPCPADVKNHGAYVSSVAKAAHGHGKPEPAATAAEHGALVSAAAQSDCGKPAGGEDDADETGKPETKASKADKAAAKAAAKADREARQAARQSAGPSDDDEADEAGEAGEAAPTGEATSTP